MQNHIQFKKLEKINLKTIAKSNDKQLVDRMEESETQWETINSTKAYFEEIRRNFLYNYSLIINVMDKKEMNKAYSDLVILILSHLAETIQE